MLILHVTCIFLWNYYLYCSKPNTEMNNFIQFLIWHYNQVMPLPFYASELTFLSTINPLSACRQVNFCHWLIPERSGTWVLSNRAAGKHWTPAESPLSGKNWEFSLSAANIFFYVVLVRQKILKISLFFFLYLITPWNYVAEFKFWQW